VRPIRGQKERHCYRHRYEDAAQALREFLRDYADHREAATARRWLERLSANGKIHAN
jgi:TolA-binding protein